MREVKISLPSLWADHHVTKVREVLSALDGVSEVMASSLAKQVTVKYDDTVSPEAIEKALSEAGYVPSEDGAMPNPPEAKKEDEFPWFKSIWGVAQTNVLEREMSGDFRKY